MDEPQSARKFKSRNLGTSYAPRNAGAGIAVRAASLPAVVSDVEITNQIDGQVRFSGLHVVILARSVKRS